MNPYVHLSPTCTRPGSREKGWDDQLGGKLHASRVIIIIRLQQTFDIQSHMFIQGLARPGIIITCVYTYSRVMFPLIAQFGSLHGGGWGCVGCEGCGGCREKGRGIIVKYFVPG